MEPEQFEREPFSRPTLASRVKAVVGMLRRDRRRAASGSGGGGHRGLYGLLTGLSYYNRLYLSFGQRDLDKKIKKNL